MSCYYTSSIFDEDEVCIPISTGGFKYGLVVESSEYISSDEEDDDYEARVKKGTVKVAWHPSGDETVIAENKLILTDRSLMPGDVIRRLISEKDSQRGFVESISAKCHIKILGTEQWIYNVDLADITTMQEWDTESEVTLDAWVGQLYEIREDIIVRFPDGARCILKDAGMLSLEDTNDKRSGHSEFAMRNFYPGQELCGSVEDYEEAKWLHTTRMHGPDKLGAKALHMVPVIVEKVEVAGVDVRWLCKGFTRAGSEKDALESPPRHVEGERLKRLKVMDCFQHCHHQLGDKGYYVVKETDTVLRSASPRQHYTPDIIQKMSSDNLTVIGTCKDGFVIARRGKEKEDTEKNEASNESVKNEDDSIPEKESLIVDNATEENDGDDELDEGDDDDEDHDDHTENNLEHSGSHSSQSFRTRNRKRVFLKGGKTLKKLRGRQPKKRLKLPERMVNPGDKVPVEIWYTFSTCRVMWQDGTSEDYIPSPELFPIHHLDEFEYFPGDFVVDVKACGTSTDYGVIVSCDHRERTCMVKWMKPYSPGKSERPEEGETTEVSVYDIKDHPDYKFRPGNTVIRVGGFEGTTEDLEAVGQVYKLGSDGSVHIWWPNNTITKSYPQDLFLITDDMSGVNSSDDWSESVEEEESEDESDVSWETEGEESTDSEEEEEQEEKEDASKKDNQSQLVWTCDDARKKGLDESLRRLQAAISGLLDVFLNVTGPFFKNSKQVFQDILEIFKKCKEMEKLLKSSSFKESEISDLIAEIKEELRKENTTKLAQHVATLYKYRNSPHFNDMASKVEKEKSDDSGNGFGTVDNSTGDQVVNGMYNEEPGTNNIHCNETESSITSLNPEKKTGKGNSLQDSLEMKDENSACSYASDSEKVSCRAVSCVGDIEEATSKQKEKLMKALIDYGTHIDDPILQIIFDTALHLAVAKSAKREIEAKKAINGSQTDTEAQGKGVNVDKFSKSDMESETSKCPPQKAKLNESANDESVGDIIESAILSVCSGDSDSAEVAAVKNSAKRKVEEMCFRVLSEPVDSGTASHLDEGTQTSMSSHIGGSKIESPSSHGSELQADSQSESQNNTKAGTGKQSAEKADLPFNHRNLCIRICKALNARLYHMQQELNRKWLAHKFGCDENASDMEIFEKMQAAMIESHEKHGKPLSLSDLPGTQEEDGSHTAETKDQDLSKEDTGSTEENNECKEGACKLPQLESEETEDVRADNEYGSVDNEGPSGFELCSSVCSSHWFKFQEQKPANQKAFNTAVRKELMLLQSSLPEGILVKAFEDRMDLFSVMIIGPAKTPYEDGLFAFDVQLPANFPSSPPVFHYHSYCNERLNPNLYEDGKVCVSLLGTWSGKGSEMWTSKSSLLQVLVSIQGLILVSEPYFNEAGYEKQRGTQHGQENSRMYNEMAILKLVQSLTKMALAPPAMFIEETRNHLNKTGVRMVKRLESWIEASNGQRHTPGTGCLAEGVETGTSQYGDSKNSQAIPPDFPLLPASKGFCLTLKKHLDNYKNVLKDHIWTKDTSAL